MARSDTLTLASSDSKSGVNWMLVAIVVLIALSSLVAIIVSAVALTKATKSDINISTTANSETSGGAATLTGGGVAQSQDEDCDRMYSIARGHDWGGYEYFDERGYITGFSQELINAVCDAAAINCRVVWESYNRCWDNEVGSHPFGGDALMEGWYDACTGWAATIERVHVFDFSTPFLRVPVAHIYKKAGADFNVNDIRGKVIAFFDGWAYDEKCLARQETDNNQGYVLPMADVLYVPGPTEAALTIANGEADAVIAAAHDVEEYVRNGQLEKAGGEFTCVISGNGMMTRKDNDFNKHWNRGFAKIKSNGTFKKLCDDANEKHGHRGEVQCIDT